MIETTQNEADIALKQMAKYHLSQIPIPNKIIKQMIKPFTSKIIDPKGEIEMPSENDRSTLAIKFRFHFWITHVPGIENDLADRLSRDKMIKHHELDHSLADEETDCTQMVEDLLWIFYNKETCPLNANIDCVCDHSKTRIKKWCDLQKVL
eukprot:124376_1